MLYILCTSLQCTILLCTVLHSTVLYCTVLYCTAPLCTVLCQTTLHHTLPSVLLQYPLLAALHLPCLLQVGFPIDHKAILWCFQLVSTVSEKMRSLSRSNRAGDVVDLRVLFFGGEECAKGEEEGEIPPVAAITSRNASLTEWRAAQLQDRAHLLNRSPYGIVQTVAFEFLTSHTFKIFVCYILLCLLCMTLPLFIALTNNTHTVGSASSWSTLHPWHHTHLVVLSPALDAAARVIVPPNLCHLITPTRPVLLYLLALSLLFILPKMLFDYIFRPLVFLTAYSPAMYWFVSYGLALGARTVLLALIVSVRWLFSSVWGILRVVLRATIWCQFIRRRVRTFMKAVRKALTTRLGMSPVLFRGDVLLGVFSVCVVCIGMVIGIVRASDRAVGSDAIYGVGTLTVSLLSLTLTLVALIALTLTVGLQTSDSRSTSEEGSGPRSGMQIEKYDHSIQLSLLLAPLPLLTFPTAYFSYSLLFLPTKTFSAAFPLFDIFGPERLTFCVCLIAVISHVITARQTG